MKIGKVNIEEIIFKPLKSEYMCIYYPTAQNTVRRIYLLNDFSESLFASNKVWFIQSISVKNLSLHLSAAAAEPETHFYGWYEAKTKT